MIPRATYRVQFHAGFPFSAAMPLVGYWAKLGISHLYASPIATARAGSNHGYDVIDPSCINPELGGESGFRALAAALKAEGIGIILDIVPNHVAVGHGDNRWWLDVLAKGEASTFAGYFDIDWHSSDRQLDGKLIAPFLGVNYADALAAGDLKLIEEDGRLAVIAHDTHVFPLRPEDQQALAGTDLSRFTAPDELHRLCERQHWRLTWWRSAGDLINWRRFFDITELAGVRIEDETVFDAIHALPVRLYGEGLIDGVRVDHIDGLSDPAAYCQRLRAVLDEAGASRPTTATEGAAYIVVEKILAQGESLPPDWPIDGTSGYDFLNDACALLHDPAGARSLGRLWHEISGRSAAFGTEEAVARRAMLERGFAGQLDGVARAFAILCESMAETRDFGLPALRRAITWLIEEFRGYRTYGTGDHAPATDLEIRSSAVRAAVERAGPGEADLVSMIGTWLAGGGPGASDLKREAVRRFQQLSAPIAAKSVEDTAFYRYGRLLSRNDVGCDPERLGAGPEDFAASCLRRARHFPHAMLATATHDHKRGEDVRARLAVLSEIPARWSDHSHRWIARAPADIDCGDAYMLHQMIVGAWPITLQPNDADGLASFRDRLAAWQQKALREAKLRTSWASVDERYEDACRRYLDALLKPNGPFAIEAAELVEKIAPAGWAKSLAQTLLRYTLPGVPDLYQGTESWDLSLVDPDNRRPVPYSRLRDLLADDDGAWKNGAAKQHLIMSLLALRMAEEALFRDGGLRFLTITGPRAGQAIAYERGAGGRRLTVVCAIRCSPACIDLSSPEPSAHWWAGTAIERADGTSLPAEDITGDKCFGYRLE